MALYQQGLLVVQDALEYVEIPIPAGEVVHLSFSTPKTRIRRVFIHNYGGTVRWVAAAGTDPSGSFGDRLDADDILIYDGDPDSIGFYLDDTATDVSTLLVHYFGA